MDNKTAPVPAPFCKRLVLTGVVASLDENSRIRLLLTERNKQGALDPSRQTLRKAFPPGSSYKIWDADSDGVHGVALITVPTRRRHYWLPIAEKLRGAEVRVEVTLRPYLFVAGTVSYSGTALDLALLDAAAPPADASARPRHSNEI
jgi:hypothetical protein